MTRDELLAAAQAELRKHDFSTFVANPPSIAEGGKGVVVPGCSHCRVRVSTISQFVEHLAVDVLPNIVDDAIGLREPGME